MNFSNEQIRARKRLVEFHEQLGLHRPTRVDLVCLGNTCSEYVKYQLRKEPSIPEADQTWTVNRGIRVFNHDLAWVMDDLKGERRIDPEYGIALETHEKPIITSTAYKGFPEATSFPLRDVVTFCGRAHMYWHNSVPYILAYALALGVEELRLWGADYTTPDGRVVEDDRANVEYWIGVARAMGMQVGLSTNSTLLNLAQHQGKAWFYGYEHNQLPLGWDTPEEEVISFTDVAGDASLTHSQALERMLGEHEESTKA